MYVCWYYRQGHKVSFSLEWRSMQSAAKNEGRKNRSSSELWTTEISRVPFWDKKMPRLKKKKKKSLTINAAKPYSGLEAGQSGSMNEWVRNPNPGKDVVSGVFDLPHQTHQLDLNFMLTEPNKSVLGSLGTPVWENDLVKKRRNKLHKCQYEDGGWKRWLINFELMIILWM